MIEASRDQEPGVTAVPLSEGIESCRRDFPVLHEEETYLDSVATSLTPVQVVDAISQYYLRYRANIHRGTYDLSMQASEKYESALTNVARFIGADFDELVVTMNATAALNTVAQALPLKPGDEVLLSTLEHTSNLAPWALHVARKGIKLRFYHPGKLGVFDIAEFEKLLTEKTRLVSMTYISNVLGTVVPVEQVAALCKQRGIFYMIDAAQAVPHLPIDVKKIGCDFMAFSGHKMLGPTGIGILYMKREHAERMIPPMLGGGSMEPAACQCSSLAQVGLVDCGFNVLPWKWQPGTPPIAEVLGLSAAVDYLKAIGFDKIQRHDEALLQRAIDGLSQIQGVDIYGPANSKERVGILSFNVAGLAPEEVGEQLNRDFKVAVRAGDHCAVQYFKEVQGRDLKGLGNVRASFYLYNTAQEVDRFVTAIDTISRRAARS
jgi:cysteine desulfurase / selenocysteine lyase